DFLSPVVCEQSTPFQNINSIFVVDILPNLLWQKLLPVRYSNGATSKDWEELDPLYRQRSKSR
ncbi:hypothetical protein C0989_011175, partial [Termitomyces sp. Mn162]